MKEIKVYLQYPWKFPDSPYYKYLINSPPEGIEYLNAKKQKGVITNKRFFWFSNLLKRNIRLWTNKLNFAVPNAHLTRSKKDFDLIHCAHCLSKNTDKPWIADIESEWQVYIGKKTKEAKEKIRKILTNKNCKKIMPWTEQTKKELIANFPEIKEKVEVVYPAIPLKINKKKFQKETTLIFSGRYFFGKGGLHALEIIDKLSKRYKNVKAIFISEVPKEILERYSKNKKIKFYGLLPQKELFVLYGKADILVYPGYSDSFGFAYLEAMSFGIPIITVDGFARKEIVEEGKTGFVADRPKRLDTRIMNEQVIKELIEKTSLLIENKNLREKMSRECLKTIKEGKFSIKERNKKLNRIYEEAIK